MGPGATDSQADLPSLGKRQCAWLDQVNNLHIAPGRAQWGGKGMYLTVLEDVGLIFVAGAQPMALVDHLFQWLVQSNERLLDFMGPQRLMHLCLSNRSAVRLSMHPRRAEIINHCAREIGHFLAEADAFLAGYKQLLMLGTASDNPEYGQCRDELTPLGEQLANVHLVDHRV